MRIAFVFPSYWPYVRRGAERLMAEYSGYLTAAGHQVDIITTKPGTARVTRCGNLTVYYEPQVTHPLLSARIRYLRFYTFTFPVLHRLLAGTYDAAHTWLYPYGLALKAARRLRGTPYLYQNMAEGVAWPSPIDRWMAAQVAGGADAVAALTPRAAANVQRELGVPVGVLPPCVDMDTLAPVVGRDIARPRVLFVSDLSAFRKGAALIFMAWDEIHRRCPQAVLVLAGPLGQGRIGVEDAAWNPVLAMKTLVQDPGALAAIEFAGEGRTADLPYQYARASVTLLPSTDDVFGLVLVESLACGTPVAGSAFQGPGDIITDPAIGATVPVRDLSDFYNPNRAHQLAEAVLYAIDLSRDPATVDRCRGHAAQWSRTAVGPELERTYRRMIGARHAAGQAAVAAAS